jgi:hypothetical protein
MNKQLNPFQFEAATSLPPEQLIEFFIEDNNFSRFIKTNRNIFLVGERGSGKTMNLLYHSIEIQKILAKNNNEHLDLSYIGIYMPCNTPLYQKNEYQLLEEKYLQLIVSENLFVLDMAYYIIKSIDTIKEYIEINNHEEMLNEIVYILNIDIPNKNNIYRGLMNYFKKESTECQRKLLSNGDVKTMNSWSFYSLIIPLFGILRELDALRNTHFMLMIDDVQYLNEYQRKLLNGLISYRDNSLFSCKVATPKINRIDMTTSTGGTILEGHDYLEIDMVQPFQNRYAAFSGFAGEIIARRLNKINSKKICADDFFPSHPQFEKELKEANEMVKEEAIANHPGWSSKQINDYVYKFGRAQYFRDRAIKANNPPYSGFEIIKHLSTGVVRNLLDPCYWMYDRVLSEKYELPIESIPPNIQSEVIIARSIKLWQKLNDGLECKVQGCTEKQSEAIKNLFEKLSILFRYRLLHHKSEPRAVVFTISGMDSESKKEIMPLLEIAQKANLLYERMSRAKDDGNLEPYYTPNRMLWPSVGLDPQGQHARVSLKAKDIIAATKGKDFPVNEDDDIQGELFDDEL